MAEFRRFNKNDWVSFNRISEEAFPDEYNNSSEQESKDQFHKMIKIEEDRFMGYFEGKELLGYTYFQLYSELAYLRSIAVNQNHRGKGYGKAILEYVMRRFREHHNTNAMLYVETGNEVAINLYKNFGFMVNKESWHFIIPVDDFNQYMDGISLDRYSLKEIISEDLPKVIQKFPNVNEEQMKSQMEKNDREEISDLYFLGLYEDDEMVGFSRFSSNFSGSMPFEYLQITHADIQVKLLETHYKLPDKEYIRITFDNYEELAELYIKRGLITVLDLLNNII